MQLSALSFQKEGHFIVKLVTFVLRKASRGWRVVTPQLIGRAVRPPPDRRGREPIEVGYLAKEPSRVNQRDVN
jgi:hypothetical protein